MTSHFIKCQSIFIIFFIKINCMLLTKERFIWTHSYSNRQFKCNDAPAIGILTFVFFCLAIQITYAIETFYFVRVAKIVIVIGILLVEEIGFCSDLKLRSSWAAMYDINARPQ